MNSLLTVENLTKRYPARSGQRRSSISAFEAVSFSLHPGLTLAVVGESASGKTSLALCLASLERATAGRIWFEGRDLTILSEAELRVIRPRTQLIFQDPASSLNPRWAVLDIVAEPLRLQGRFSKSEIRDKVIAALVRVGLSGEVGSRRPRELSGGQRQRVAIARALVLQVNLLILDEVLSSLDGSVQAQICNLLLELQRLQNLSYIFITHDINMAAHVADEIAVMHRGKIVEYGPVTSVLHAPQAGATRALINAIPSLQNGTPTPVAP